MIEVSIIIGHYSEDKAREDIARRCLIAASKQRNKTTELILILNGRYPYRDEFIKYADQWHERDADSSPGRSGNIGFKMARGNIFFPMCDDVLLQEGAVAECVRLIKEFPQYLISPMKISRYKMRYFGHVLDNGYITNDRGGDDCYCITRKQSEIIGPIDEIDPLTDGINYTNRRIAKGYTVLLTKRPMAVNLAQGKHSFMKQSQEMGYKGYKHKKPIYSKEELTKLSYGT